eukprot:TRINITY_DN6083_c0_g1_i1.p1 TRINITY_DN6083_c0_g1~~TRINITY_DN6083_c0_g1_i1.p1  ORF type:complete len:122 (+),score=17.05 TRINITY_DN6083_c0_g1_i1:56-367(+)
MTKPIVSVSFGNSVVFLMGGRTRDIKPIPFFIRSGDVVIMSGESRYYYHSVPRMIENTIPPLLLLSNQNNNNTVNLPNWDFCKEYIVNARININCRQVNPSVN